MSPPVVLAIALSVAFTIGPTVETARAQEPSAAAACIAGLGARPGVAGVMDAYRRTATLLVDGVLLSLARRSSAGASRSVCVAGPWNDGHAANDGIRRGPAQIDVAWNSDYARDDRTGALWPGRGASVLASAGIELRHGQLSARVEPAVTWAANEEFPYVTPDTTSPFAYPWNIGIDWPIRPGDEGVSTIGPGQSYVRIDFPALAFGVSSENLWWGPATRNAILLGNEAAGFPHAFATSGDGWSSPAGRVTAEAVLGRLAASDQVRTAADVARWLGGALLGWEPAGLSGLTLGGAAVRVSAEDAALQLGGLFTRYHVPGSGFEVYAEWARQAAADSVDSASGYTVGFQQAAARGGRWYRLRGELTNLNAARYVGASTPTWYTHPEVTAGYTHEGQLLGARIGPGSDAQFLGVDVFTARGRHEVFVERVRYDEVSHYRFIVPVTAHTGHDVELSAGTSHLLRLGSFSLSAGLTVSSRRNRHFRHCNPVVEDPPRQCQARPFRDLNWHVPLGLIWHPD